MNITFNDTDLSQYIKVLNADRSLLPSVENSVTKVTTRSGGFFDWDRLEIREISVKYALITDDTESLQKLKRKLAGVLKTSEPKKLIFSDEPDVYYMAKLDSDTALEQTLGIAEGVLKFICIDPLAYSNEVKSITNSADKSVLTVNYEGTADSLPVVSAKFNSECGYLALINKDGRIVQVGKPEEVDKVAYQRNETVIHEDFKTDVKKWTLNVAKLPYQYFLGNPEVPNRQSGSYNWANPANSITPVYQNVSAAIKSWGGGPAITQNIPTNSEGSRIGNFQSRVRFKMKQGEIKATNRSECILQTGEDVLAAAILRDSSEVKQEYRVEFWVMGKKLDDIVLNIKDYQKSDFEMLIQRIQDTFTFTLSEINSLQGNQVIQNKSITRSYTISGVASKPVEKVHLWMAKLSNKPVLQSEWNDLKFVWVGVDKIQDIPNQFQPDDELLIDFSSGKIFLNSVLSYSLGALGNDFFPLVSGDNEIYIASSEWTTDKPEIELTYREAFY